MTAAVIVAGGKGRRMKSSIRKQYLHLGGIPLLARTLSVFNDCPDIRSILLVIPEEDIEHIRKNVLSFLSPVKEIRLVPGGRQRQESVYNGLKEIKDGPSVAVIHDGVRPFISCDDIRSCILAAEKHGTGILGTPMYDTLKRVDDHHFVVETIERKGIWQIQTPQAFQLPLLMDAHAAAIKTGISATDDAVLVERLGKAVKMVTGNKYNIKITTPEDLKLAESIAQLMD